MPESRTQSKVFTVLPTEMNTYTGTKEQVDEQLAKGDDPNLVDAVANGRVRIIQPEQLTTPVPASEVAPNPEAVYEDQITTVEDNPSDTPETEVERPAGSGEGESGVEATPSEEPEVQEEFKDEQEIDEVEAKRQLWDNLEQENIDAKAELLRIQEEAGEEKAKLLAEIDSLKDRTAKEAELGTMTDEEWDSHINSLDQQVQDAEASNASGVQTDTTIAPNELSEIKAQLGELRANREAEEAAKRKAAINDEYTDFQKSEYGSSFKFDRPIGEALADVDNLHNQLTAKLGSAEKATRFILDFKNPALAKSREEQLTEMGFTKSEDFDKAFEAIEVRMYKNGEKFDTDTGRLIKVRKNGFESMEEAYFNLNGKKVIAKAKIDAHMEIKEKLDQRNNAAVAADPSQYSAPPTADRTNDPVYISGVYKQVQKYVRNGQLNVKDIPDGLRQQYQAIKMKQQTGFKQ
jgi:hypothetical protein